MSLIARGPTEEELEQSARFRTYLNYIDSIYAYLIQNYTQAWKLVFEIAGTSTFKKITSGHCRDVLFVERHLRNAWFTEIQMHLVEADDKLVPYSNHWAPVQLYYAVYSAIRAFYAASNQTVNADHTATLASMSKEIKNRCSLFPIPWGLLCSGDPDNNPATYHNLPSGVKVNPVSSLSTGKNVPLVDSLGMLLRTTRKRSLDSRIDRWKRKEHRKRILAQERKQLVINLHPTSMFDSLYRLRTRSNYDDADSFILTLGDADEAQTFNIGLREICWHTLLLLECLICRYVGRSKYDGIVSRFGQHELSLFSAKLSTKRHKAIQLGYRKVGV